MIVTLNDSDSIETIIEKINDLIVIHGMKIEFKKESNAVFGKHQKTVELKEEETM